MSASRETERGATLDAMIAEHVMGERVYEAQNGERLQFYGKYPEGFYATPRPYSSQIGMAWRVVEKLNADGRYPEVQYGPTEPNGEPLWRVSLVNPADVEVFAETLPLAICRAALSAVSSAPAGRTPE